MFLILVHSSEFSELGSRSSSSSVLAEAATLYSADRHSLQDTAIFYSQRRTLPSDMESEPQICEMLDLLFDVKDFTDL